MPPKCKRQKRGDKRTQSGTRKSQRASVKKAISTVNDKDWREGKTLSESMLTMFTDEISCDVHFLCGEDEVRVGAHKFILLCRSSVFYAMFEGPAGNQDTEVKIPDITADIFRSFLRYMYSDKAEITEENLTKMLYIGKKYQVYSLINECCAYIQKILVVDNACTMFEVSHTYSEPRLHRSVLQFIEDNIDDIYSSDTYKDLCRECFGEILELDEIWFSDSEEEEEDEEENDPFRSRSRSRSRSSSRSRSRSKSLDRGEESTDEDENDEPLEYHEDTSVNVERQQFNMLVSWTDSECKKQNLERTGENRRLVAGDLVTKIRYSFLDSEFVVRRVSESGLLSMEQQCKVMKSLLCSEITKNVFWKNESRQLHSSALFFSRFDTKSENQVTVNKREAISIKCFEDLYFHGFTVFKKAINSNAYIEYSGSATVTDESGEVLCGVDIRFKDVWRTKDEEVMPSLYPDIIFRKKCIKTIWFHRKILLKKNCKYNIIADIAGPDSYCGELNDSALPRFKENFPIMYWDEENDERKIVEIMDYDSSGYGGSTDLTGGQFPDLAFSLLQ